MHRKIIIEGAIGVGKSSLAKKIARALGYPLLLEKPEENTFLADFYTKNAQEFTAQVSFLLQRREQIHSFLTQRKSSNGWVSDFMLEKDALFAQLTLSDQEYVLYKKLCQQLPQVNLTPDLVICLQAPEKILLERIKKRNRLFEKHIQKDYLSALNHLYTEYFHQYSKTPSLIINAAIFNPIDNEAHFSELIGHIETVQSGKNFLNPLT